MRLSRLFAITYLLLDRESVTARELAQRFEVSVRTIYRDVETLGAAGVPVYMARGRNGGLRILPDFVLDKTVLTPEERDDILSSLAGLKAAGNSAQDDALKKLASLFGGTGHQWIEVDYSGWGWGNARKQHFQSIKSAVLSHRVLSFDYFGARGEKTARDVEPLKLVFKGQAWYAYGWCRMRGGYRFFKLSRMENLAVREEVFNRRAPESILPERTEPPEAETTTVKFRAAAPAAFRVYDAFPHGCIDEDADGSLIVEHAFARGDWLADFFLSLGAHVEVLEPHELREQIREQIDLLQARYGKKK